MLEAPATIDQVINRISNTPRGIDRYVGRPTPTDGHPVGAIDVRVQALTPTEPQTPLIPHTLVDVLSALIMDPSVLSFSKVLDILKYDRQDMVKDRMSILASIPLK